jgi:cytidyltransferase-like protein
MSSNIGSKTLSLQDLQEKVATLRREHPGIKIGLTTGAFLVPHTGHFSSFEKAKKNCDVLIVVMSSTSSLEKKGRMHPLVGADAVRAAALAESCDEVDFVVCNDDSNAVAILQTLKPDVFFKGDEEQYRTMDHPEQKAVLAYGGQVILTEIDDQSLRSKTLIRQMVEEAKTKSSNTSPVLSI